jgi:MFS family permease
MDYFGISARRGDCLTYSLSFLLLARHKDLDAFGRIHDSLIVVTSFAFWVNIMIFLSIAQLINLLCRGDFIMMMTSRILGGMGCGILFIILPSYMKELLNMQSASSIIVDILITQFGVGISLPYFFGESFSSYFLIKLMKMQFPTLNFLSTC